MANEAVLAEYKAVRSEIEQLNGQGFATIGSSLGLNLTILVWFFGRAPTTYALPTIGIVLLFFGSLVLVNRIRLAHRLAYFQKYFIETRVPDICWARVYFEYRAEYKKKGIILANIEERLAESGARILFFASALNIAILIYFLFENTNAGAGFNLVVSLCVLLVQGLLSLRMTIYEPIGQIMRDLAKCTQIELND